jgi:hypothetical protein
MKLGLLSSDRRLFYATLVITWERGDPRMVQSVFLYVG